MAQQNIDFGAFPDDPNADAIRDAFQKVQNNFTELFVTGTAAQVSSINRSPGAGITVNSSIGNVIVSANIANVTVSSPNLVFGTSLGTLSSTLVYPSSSQTLYIVVPNTFSIGNVLASGDVTVTGKLSVTGISTLGNSVTANYFIGSGNNLSNIQGANVTGVVSGSNTAITVTSNSQPNITSLGTLTSLSVSGNVTTGNANLGNAAIANYFIGSGANLTNIPGANITGTIANSNYSAYAGNVVNASQSNITAVGSLASLSVVANANIGNIGTAGIITATGNIAGGNLITSGLITATGNITGGNVNTAGLISAIGNINGGNLNTTGMLSVGGNANVGNISASLFVGNLSGAGNSNTGNLGVTGVYATTLSSTGNSNVGNLGTAGLITATGNITGNNLFASGLISVTGNANIGNLSTAGSITATGNIQGANLVTGGNLSVTGTATVGNLSVTGNLTAGNITVDSIVNGTSNVDITNPGGNVTVGVNGNANIFTITDVGVVVLGTLSSSGNANVGNLGTTGVYATTLSATGNANVGNIGAALHVGNLSGSGNSNVGNLGVSGLITSTGNIQGGNVVTGGVISATGNANVGNVGATQVFASANVIAPQLISNVANGTPPLVVTSTTQVANLSVAVAAIANQAGNVTGSSQPNITSLGNLIGLTSNGTINFDNSTNISLANANVLRIGGGSLNTVLISDGTGGVSWGSYSGSPIGGSNTQIQFNDGGLFSGTSNLTFDKTTNTLNATNITGTTFSISGNSNVGNMNATGSIVSSGNLNAGNIGTGGLITATGNIAGGNLITGGQVSASGNITGSYYFGNGSQLTGIAVTSFPAANLTGTTLSSNVVTSSLTAVGTLASLSVTGKVTAGQLQGDGGNISNIQGGNVSGAVSSATTAGTVTTNAQPNITSTGTLASLSVSGNATVGNLSGAGNITGGNLSTGGILTVSGNGNIANGLFVSNTQSSYRVITISGDSTYTGFGGGQLAIVDASTKTKRMEMGYNSTANVGFIQAGVSGGSVSPVYINIDGGDIYLGQNVATFTGVFVRPLTNSTSTTSGALVVSGGAGIAGNIYAGGILSVTGNANIGNIGTAGLITATGNITGGNLVTGGAISATANSNVGNLGVSFLVSSGSIQGNVGVTGGNLLSLGTLSVTGNSNISNLGTSGLITATGNIQGGNLITGGILSVTGNTTLSNGVAIATSLVANNGVLQLGGHASVQALLEKATVSATAATGTINFDALTQPILYYTTNASANFTLNVRGNSTVTANAIMATGQSMTVAFLNTNGATAYYANVFQVDGANVTPKWQGGTAPTAGNANSIDAYTYSIIKTGSATYTVLASLTQYK